MLIFLIILGLIFLFALDRIILSSGRISGREAWKRVKEGAILIDVRSIEEYQSGHAESAVNVPLPKLESTIKKIAPDLLTSVVVYCLSGHRSFIAAKKLRSLGYQKVAATGTLAALIQTARE